MDGPGSVGPDMLPYSAAGPSSRSGSYVGPPASAPFGGLSHPLGGAGMVGGTQGSGEVPNNGDFAMTLASPGSGPGVVIRSASRSDSGAAPLGLHLCTLYTACCMSAGESLAVDGTYFAFFLAPPWYLY